MPYTNVQIKGSNKRKIIIVTIIVSVLYYIFFYSQNKQITRSQLEVFLGQSIFFIALQNTPFIIL
jgi:hypothetical protein